MTAEVRTTCPYCGVGCGVLATPDGQGGAAIAGDPEHPANLGRLCSKGSALGETLSLENRLLHPHLNGARVSWDAALGTVASEMARIAEAHGPEAIAFYLSGQLLTEDYYVANKLAKGFVGTPHVETNPACACRARWRPTAGPSARTRCPAATKTSTRPTSSCWSARTPRGATPSCSAAWPRPRRGGARNSW